MEIQNSIDLYEALEKMKNISAAGGSFAFKFRKWNRQTRKGGDIVCISRARVRPKASDEKIDSASYKLFFTDIDTGRALNCWQPLITEFNGRPTILN